jgi:hypothetical protein
MPVNQKRITEDNPTISGNRDGGDSGVENVMNGWESLIVPPHPQPLMGLQQATLPLAPSPGAVHDRSISAVRPDTSLAHPGEKKITPGYGISFTGHKENAILCLSGRVTRCLSFRKTARALATSIATFSGRPIRWHDILEFGRGMARAIDS